MENKNENNENIQKDNLENNNRKRNTLNKSQNSSPLRTNSKKRTSLYSKVYINMKEQLLKKRIDDISLNDLNDKEIQDLYYLLKKTFKERNKKDNIDIFIFLLKTRTKENFKSDLLHTEYNLDTLYNFICPYISGSIYNSGEIIYSHGDEAENFYLILKGNIGQYKLVETEKLLSSEDYYSYLCEKFLYFKKTVIDGNKDINFNYINEKEYTDIDLLRKMVSINKEIYPLNTFDDLEDLPKIMIQIKLYIKLVENKPKEVIDLYNKFNFPLSFLNYDKLLTNNITAHNFIQNLTKKIKQREQFYMKILGKMAEYKVKLLKYEKIENLQPYDYFGNFEIIDTKPIRVDTARCENDCTVLLVFNKKSYSRVINSLQKDKRDEEITFLHGKFYFKNINKLYFEAKMFIKYRINNFLKGNILINQDEKINNFIFVREGTIETSINNISLLELINKIKILQEFIIAKAKEYDINIKDIIDFDMSLNFKTNLQLEKIEGILKQKQSFILSRAEKGCFGEYEYFFKTPSFVTETIISKNAKVYFYDFNNFKKINEEVHAFNEILKETSFSKLKSILKRMIAIYNSYFKFNMKQVETKILESENKLKNINSLNSTNEEDFNYIFDQQQKHFSSPITLFQKNSKKIFNIINSKNEYNNIDNNINESIENNNTNKNIDINTFSFDLDKIKRYRKKLTQIKKKKEKKEKKENSNSLRKKIMGLKNSINRNARFNYNNFSTDNSFKEKKKIKLNLKIKESKNNDINLKKKDINSKNDNILKTENSQKRKQFNVFLPPLLPGENNKNNHKIKNLKESSKNEKLNYHFCKNYISIANSINDGASLGHKDKKNNNLILSNIDDMNNLYKKSKSINIKRAQINIIKNRDIKMQLILKKKNEEEDYYD